jgi:hypothetical protein
MTYNSEIKLGPLTRAICESASWKGQDDFPSNQIWADEVEKVLYFLQIQGKFERYLPNLKGKLTQRDGALAEARVAFFFHLNGFLISSWEPKGADNRLGEFDIQWKNTLPLFVEVKGPRWEGELEDYEKSGLRLSQPRYINGEGRWINPIEKVINAAKKAAPKFLSDRPNLLVVTGDLLFVSPNEIPRDVVEPQLSYALSEQKFSVIGGIMLFDARYTSECIEYQITFVENPNAGPLCAIPAVVAKGPFRKLRSASGAEGSGKWSEVYPS